MPKRRRTETAVDVFKRLMGDTPRTPSRRRAERLGDHDDQAIVQDASGDQETIPSAWLRDALGAQCVAQLEAWGVDLGALEAILVRGGRNLVTDRLQRGFVPDLKHGRLVWQRDQRKPPTARRRADQYRYKARRLLTAALRERAETVAKVDAALDAALRHVRAIRDDLTGLEEWGAYNLPAGRTRRSGRPDAAVTRCAADVRGLLPRRASRDLVAEIIRVGLGVSVDADALRERVRKQRRRAR